MRTLLFRVAGAHDALLGEANVHRENGPSADLLLALGAGVRIHHVMMELIPDSLRSVADEGLIAELGVEATRLDENLDYLKSLCAAEPQSPDVAPLTAALLDRIRQHLERCDRVLFRPLQRLYPKEQ
jgi:hypothetical protein